MDKHVVQLIYWAFLSSLTGQCIFFIFSHYYNPIELLFIHAILKQANEASYWNIYNDQFYFSVQSSKIKGLTTSHELQIDIVLSRHVHGFSCSWMCFSNIWVNWTGFLAKSPSKKQSPFKVLFSHWNIWIVIINSYPLLLFENQIYTS